MVAAVAAVDIARVVLGIHAMSRGVPELWAHDVPDTLLYYPTVAFAGWIALRRDLRCHSRPEDPIGDDRCAIVPTSG
jgi:hypothetical protein